MYNPFNYFRKEPKIPNLTKEQALGLMAQLHENPAFIRFLEAREQYLKDRLTDDIIAGKVIKAEGFAGQILEIRNLRARTRASHLAIKKLRSEKTPTEGKT